MLVELRSRKVDVSLLTLVILLTLFGTIMLYSASSTIALERFGDAGYYFKKHLIRLCMSAIVFGFFLKLNLSLLHKYSKIILISALALLWFTYISYKMNGITSPARWLDLGFFQFQTSEFAKFALITYCASYVVTKKGELSDFRKGFLPVIGLVSLGVGLIIIQPDFSTAAIIGLICLVILFIGGARIAHLSAYMTFGIICMGFIVLSSPYKLQRILTYFSDESSPASSYQIQQSLISLGNGGLTGIGLGESIEKNLFLPEPHTDFIFSIIGEEIGFIGAAVILFAFIYLFIRGLQIIKAAISPFIQLFGFGLLFSVTLYAFINIAVVTGLVPTTGLPLPFFSYGGSSMIYLAVVFGCLLNISKGSLKREIPNDRFFYYD